SANAALRSGAGSCSNRRRMNARQMLLIGRLRSLPDFPGVRHCASRKDNCEKKRQALIENSARSCQPLRRRGGGTTTYCLNATESILPTERFGKGCGEVHGGKIRATSHSN